LAIHAGGGRDGSVIDRSLCRFLYCDDLTHGIDLMRLRPLVALLLFVGSGGAGAADLVVSAASSLTDAFQAVGKAYEVKHPGTHVVFNFAASDVLLRQIASGAPVDVFASADQAAMDKAVAARAIDPATRQDFASNRLVLIVPKDATVRLNIDVGVGDIQLPGDGKKDVDVEPGKHKKVTLTPVGGGKNSGTLELDLQVGLGQAEVDRAAS